MAVAVLAQEKVWFDKPFYDKAERLYYERKSKTKVVNGPVTKTRQNSLNATNPPSKSKPEKSMNNKSVTLEDGTNDDSKQSKCQVASSRPDKKESDCGLQKGESLEGKERQSDVDAKEKELNMRNNVSKKLNAKEAKEKKNKADTRHRNRGRKERASTKEHKEQLPEQMQGNQQSTCSIPPSGGSLANEVARARRHIKQFLRCMDDIATISGVSTQDVTTRVANLEKENQDLRNVVQELRSVVGKLEERVKALEEENQNRTWPRLAICPPCPPCKRREKEDEEEPGENEEALITCPARRQRYGKLNVIFNIRPRDENAYMTSIEAKVRDIAMDSLVWGAAKVKGCLQMSCVFDEDKISIDSLKEKIEQIKDLVEVEVATTAKI